MSELHERPIANRETDGYDAASDMQQEHPAGLLLDRRQFLRMVACTGAAMAVAACDSTGGPDPWEEERARLAADRPPGEVILRRTPEEWEGDARLADDRTRQYSIAALRQARTRANWRDGLLTLHVSTLLPVTGKTGTAKPEQVDYKAAYLVPRTSSPAPRRLSAVLADPATKLYRVDYINGSQEGSIEIYRGGPNPTDAVDTVVVGGEPATLSDVRQRVVQAASKIDATAHRLGL